MTHISPGAQSSESPQFSTTQWSLVLAAGADTSKESRDALAQLCERYWYPLYAYVRRQGYGCEESQDLTQSFFARLLEKNIIRSADRTRGRFRCFLLASLKNFLANEWDRSQARKRGGDVQLISLTGEDFEQRYGKEPAAHDLSPERLFDRRWAVTLLQHVLDELRQELAGQGKQQFFERVKGYLSGEDAELSYREMGAELGMNEAALKMSIHRLRRRYGELIRQHIAQTVESSDEIADELRHLLAAVSA